MLLFLSAIPLLGDRTHYAIAFAGAEDMAVTQGGFVSAEVTEESYDSGREKYRCWIRVGYRVDGELREVNDGLISQDQEAVEQFCRPYQSVEEVPVYHLVAHPEHASLRREDFGAWERAVLMLMGLPAGIALLITAVLRNRRDLREQDG